MNSTGAVLLNRAPVLLLAMVFAVAPGRQATGQNVQHLSITQPGGLPGLPLMTGIQRVTNGLRVTWDGPPGYYQLLQKPALAGSKWQAVGKATNLARRATITALSANAFFGVSGPAPRYAGSHVCLACHQNIHDTEMNTRHAQAFATLKLAHQDTNSACLPCHTVGYGLPSGFQSETATPQLAGVQCENCHGPAANHAASESDPTVRPRVELAATVCGGCHSGPQGPTFEEWSASGHAGLVEDMNPTNRIDSCGRCHSGSARNSLLQGEPLPFGDANVPIVCVTCHDPHRTNAYPAQLRYPLASTNDYFVTTAGVFTNQINPGINLCAQCHNHRGAAWTDSSRPPHHSAQYNFLLGTIGELDSGLAPYQPAAHALWLTNQCVDCHMPTAPCQGLTQPAMTGHKFKVESYGLCLSCHPYPQLLVEFTTGAVSNRLQQVKAALDLWAATKAPASLWTKYGARAWEYTTPGQLSPGGPGPASTEQALIPVNLRKARFNLYLVLNDGSFGVHNGPYSIVLLDQASEWIQTELDQ
ncbi:MAG: multiheme c-type cytochrome [Verrucomicrobiota bacterium]|jgi:hypothetical protein